MKAGERQMPGPRMCPPGCSNAARSGGTTSKGGSVDPTSIAAHKRGKGGIIKRNVSNLLGDCVPVVRWRATSLLNEHSNLKDTGRVRGLNSADRVVDIRMKDGEDTRVLTRLLPHNKLRLWKPRKRVANHTMTKRRPS